MARIRKCYTVLLFSRICTKCIQPAGTFVSAIRIRKCCSVSLFSRMCIKCTRAAGNFTISVSQRTCEACGQPLPVKRHPNAQGKTHTLRLLIELVTNYS